MKIYSITAGAGVFLALISGVCGCNSTPPREVESALKPLMTADPGVVSHRCAGLKKIISPMKVRGAGINLSAFRNSGMSNREITGFLRKMGFNRIYCTITSETGLNEFLKEFIISASAAGLPVELRVCQGDFIRRHRGNALVRAFLPEFITLKELGAEIAGFNEQLPENARLAGVTLRFEPHVFTAVNGADKIPGLHYLWSSHTFGPGLDNDRLTILSVEQAAAMKKALGGIPCTIELPDFYHDWAVAGKLSCGKVSDFAGFDGIMIQSTGNVPTALVKGIEKEYAARKGLMTVIPVADHTSVRSGALRRRNWRDFANTLNYFVRSTGKMGGKGVVIRPMSELMFMLWEKN